MTGGVFYNFFLYSASICSSSSISFFAVGFRVEKGGEKSGLGNGFVQAFQILRKLRCDKFVMRDDGTVASGENRSAVNDVSYFDDFLAEELS